MNTENEPLTPANETSPAPTESEQTIEESMPNRIGRRLAKGALTATYLAALVYIDIKLAGK